MSIVEWVILAVVVLGILIALFGLDRYRGNRKSSAESGDLQPTDEVFVDPTTGQRLRVWYSPKTGRREYRPE